MTSSPPSPATTPEVIASLKRLPLEGKIGYSCLQYLLARKSQAWDDHETEKARLHNAHLQADEPTMKTNEEIFSDLLANLALQKQEDLKRILVPKKTDALALLEFLDQVHALNMYTAEIVIAQKKAKKGGLETKGSKPQEGAAADELIAQLASETPASKDLPALISKISTLTTLHNTGRYSYALQILESGMTIKKIDCLHEEMLIKCAAYLRDLEKDLKKKMRAAGINSDVNAEWKPTKENNFELHYPQGSPVARLSREDANNFGLALQKYAIMQKTMDKLSVHQWVDSQGNFLGKENIAMDKKIGEALAVLIENKHVLEKSRGTAFSRFWSWLGQKASCGWFGNTSGHKLIEEATKLGSLAGINFFAKPEEAKSIEMTTLTSQTPEHKAKH